MNRFFQIGFHKCGTTSLAHFFDRCGIPCVHWDRGGWLRGSARTWQTGGARRKAASTSVPLPTLSYFAGTEWFDGFLLDQALDAAHGGRFILNTRPVEPWLESVAPHDARRDPELNAAHYPARFGTTDPAEVALAWRRLWEEHHRRVREDIDPHPLLVFDIESDPPERLCDFIGVDRAMARHWRREHPSLGSAGRNLSRLFPRAVKRALPRPV